MKKMVFQNGFVGIALVAIVVAALSAASCASAPKGESKKAQIEEYAVYPPTIENWRTANPDAYYGVGTFAMDGDESYSVEMARTNAFGELTRSIETSAAYIGTRYSEKGGTTGTGATKNRAANVLRGARTVGPVMAKGNIYILQFIPRNEFNNSMKEAALESRAKISEAELDELFDEAFAESKKY